MVTRRCRDHAALTLRIGEHRHPCTPTANLERACSLEVLHFEIEVVTLRKCSYATAAVHRCLANKWTDITVIHSLNRVESDQWISLIVYYEAQSNS